MGYPPDVTEFCYITDDTYSKRQVLRMEQLVLGVLNFECAPPTPYFFVNHLAGLAGCGKRATALAQYLTELTMIDGEAFMPFAPSIIARPPWPCPGTPWAWLPGKTLWRLRRATMLMISKSALLGCMKPLFGHLRWHNKLFVKSTKMQVITACQKLPRLQFFDPLIKNVMAPKKC